MSARSQAQCVPSCARYRSPFSAEGMAAGREEPFCAAFPDGIPAAIWTNEFDHRQPHDGDHGLRWESNEGAAFPAYTLAPGILDRVSDGESALTAAADVMTGAMIALVPSAPDLERLVVEGGEPLDQLHLTLLYLGDAVELDQSTRDELVAWAREAVGPWDSIEGDAFAPALFNPTGEEPCVVMLCSGYDLAEFHETVVADVSEFVSLPDQHAPWIPHMTAIYLNSEDEGLFTVKSLAALATRTGAITFDRLRLAFGGEVIDIPFDDGEETPAPGQLPAPDDATTGEVAEELPVPSPPPVVAAGGAPLFDSMGGGERTEFDGCLRCYGPAHDGECPAAL